ncbi:MAG: glutamyl-tRNA reductase [Helicobacteraceae bacterium]|jgi:glutamyl-tRNA reductase|nr:glutamyl-tRNA reductase [Helicobacteraceae bacterium]
MRYLLISISYKNTELVAREKFAFDATRQERILQTLQNAGAVAEAALLVTCNRVELIMSALDLHAALSSGLDALHKESGVDRVEIEGRAHSYEDEGAARHLFSVASGLESVVVGESQIAGQFKDAFKFAFDRGFASKRLRALSDHAMRCAAAVRASTEVGKNPVSVSSAAIAQAKVLANGSLEDKTAIVVGSGEMSRLTALHLIGAKAKTIVVGRDLEKTEEFVKELGEGAQAASFAKLPQLINAHQFLFTATGAPHTVINSEMIESVDFDRFWFDIAVPRDIGAIEDERIKVFVVDDLQSIVKTNMSLREEEASKAFRIVGEFVEDFYGWLNSQGAEPLIKALRNKAEEACRIEVERAMKKCFIPHDSEHAKNVERLLHSAFKRFLHAPTIALRLAMDKQNSETISDVIKDIFDLEGK